MTAPLRIAIAGRFYWHNGSSHALLGYTRAGQHLGYDVRASLLGIVDEVVRQKVPTADWDWKPDLLFMVCEERFLMPQMGQQVDRICPRSRRVLIDPDGKYSPVTVAGTDTNHLTVESRFEWAANFEALSDKIVQPAVGAPAPGTHRFLYFGIDAHRPRQVREGNKPYEMVYVGNNWYRWRDMAWLIEALSRVRSTVKRIAIFGQWWTGDTVPGCEYAMWSDPQFLRDNGVETFQSAPFDDVELTMALGRLSPIFVRPVLNALEFATPRMFETFAADTVPILPPYLQHAPALYGDRVAPLLLPEDPSRAIVAMLENYGDYVALAKEIAERLAREHSYEVRLSQLIELGLS